jgi:hypothetical protein
MMALNKPPDELMTCVFRKLETPNDLPNVALCSRRFYNLVVPVLSSSSTDDGAVKNFDSFPNITSRGLP